MDDSNAGSAQEDRASLWTSETLPISVRRELLERELKKLGFRKAGSHGHDGPAAQQQQQPQGGSEHPRADDSEEHGD